MSDRIMVMHEGDKVGELRREEATRKDTASGDWTKPRRSHYSTKGRGMKELGATAMKLGGTRRKTIGASIHGVSSKTAFISFLGGC